MKEVIITIMWQVSVERLNAEEALEKLREYGEAEITEVKMATEKEVKKMKRVTAGRGMDILE